MEMQSDRIIIRGMKMRRLYVGLVLLTLFVFRRAYFANYVLWDDDALIFNNIILKMPFAEALKTSFTNFYHGDYFPLTLMSYWADFQIFGMNAGMQHLINLLLQVSNVVLLVMFLRRYTKDSVFVVLAAVGFAIHP
jgi:hypothetical protein